jgi:hypothetical protein
MTQSSQDPSWLPLWIAAIVPAVVAIGALVKRFLSMVTREELRVAIQDSAKIIDERHAENLRRFENQDKELKEIRSGLARIEGTLSGRYPKVPGQ